MIAIIAVTGGGVVLVLLGMLVAAALGVDGFHGDRRQLAPVHQVPDQSVRQLRQAPIKVTSVRVEQVEAAS